MLRTQSVEQFDSKLFATYGFRIKGKLSDGDLESMADVMNEAFDQLEKVDMLLVFEAREGVEFAAGLSLDVLKSRFRALSNVRNYCVVNAPKQAENLIEFFDNLMPVKARTFGSEHNALEYLRSQPELETENA